MDEQQQQQQQEAEVHQQVLTACRAKMRVNRVATEDYGQNMQYKKVFLGAIYGTSGENADYAKATPSGECWLQIDAGVPASDFFKPGKDYYVTFEEAPK